jgi:hypothetical protein
MEGKAKFIFSIVITASIVSAVVIVGLIERAA